MLRTWLKSWISTLQCHSRSARQLRSDKRRQGAVTQQICIETLEDRQLLSAVNTIVDGESFKQLNPEKYEGLTWDNVTAADLNGDGLQDVISSSTQHAVIVWHRNLGNGDFATTQSQIIIGSSQTQGREQIPIAQTMTNSNSTPVLVVLLDDRRTGTTRIESFQFVADDNGNVDTLRSVLVDNIERVDGASTVNTLETADLDGDGDQDVVVGGVYWDSSDDDKDPHWTSYLAWHENEGSNQFGDAIEIEREAIGSYRGQIAGSSRSIVLSDIDGDGDQDIFTTAWKGESLRWFENNGPSDGVPSFKRNVIGESLEEGVDEIRVADLNDDGHREFFARSYVGQTVRLFANDGQDRFDSPITIASGSTYSDLNVADIDGDGKTDVFVASTSRTSQTMTWYANLGQNADGHYDFSRALKFSQADFEPQNTEFAHLSGNANATPILLAANGSDIVTVNGMPAWIKVGDELVREGEVRQVELPTGDTEVTIPVIVKDPHSDDLTFSLEFFETTAKHLDKKHHFSRNPSAFEKDVSKSDHYSTSFDNLIIGSRELKEQFLGAKWFRMGISSSQHRINSWAIITKNGELYKVNHRVLYDHDNLNGFDPNRLINDANDELQDDRDLMRLFEPFKNDLLNVANASSANPWPGGFVGTFYYCHPEQLYNAQDYPDPGISWTQISVSDTYSITLKNIPSIEYGTLVLSVAVSDSQNAPVAQQFRILGNVSSTCDLDMPGAADPTAGMPAPPPPGAIGDLNGDGVSDLVYSNSMAQVGLREQAGEITIIYGSRGRMAPIAELWNQDTQGIQGVAEAGDRFGHTVVVGDFNNDGYDDVAVGVPGEDIGRLRDAGAVNILYGSRNGLTAARNRFISQNTYGVRDRSESGDGFGTSLAVGDFNGDGRDDLAVGVPGEDLRRYGYTIRDAGAVQVFNGSYYGITTSRNQFWHQDRYGIGSYARSGDKFGAALATFDFNGDRRSDLIVGVPGEDLRSLADAGAVNIILGSRYGLTYRGNRFHYVTDTRVRTDLTSRPVSHFDFQLLAGIQKFSLEMARSMTTASMTSTGNNASQEAKLRETVDRYRAGLSVLAERYMVPRLPIQDLSLSHQLTDATFRNVSWLHSRE